MAKAIKVNEFNIVLKNPHNLFFGQVGKTKINVFNFYKNLIYNIILLC